MQVESKVKVSIGTEFLNPMTLEQVKQLRSDNSNKGRRSISAYIQPQAEWFEESTDRIPLNIPAWMNEHELFNMNLTAVVARDCRRVQEYYSRSDAGAELELISAADPMEMIYVHYVTINNKYLNGRSVTTVEVHMGGKRHAMISDNYAEIRIGDELIRAWAKVIRTNKVMGESRYEWICVKNPDEPWRPLDKDIVVASVDEKTKWPKTSSAVFAYRNLRRLIAPLYEYGMYSGATKSREEMELSSKVSLLGKKFDQLFEQYRRNYGSVPLHFGSIYQQMLDLTPEVKAADDHVGNAELVSRCIFWIGEEISREENRQELRKRSRLAA